MSYKLLLVEDDAELREIITDYFSQKSGETYEITSACTGMEGQDKCSEKEYDVVLLDIMLPEVNGFTIQILLSGSLSYSICIDRIR